jgi:hypothetical protein
MNSRKIKIPLVNILVYETHTFSAGVLTAMGIKSSILSDITSCSTVKVILRFGKAYRRYLQGQRDSPQVTSTKQAELCTRLHGVKAELMNSLVNALV